MRIAINGWFWNQPGVGSGQYLRHLTKFLARSASPHELILGMPEEPLTKLPAKVRALVWRSRQSWSPRWRKLAFEQAAFPQLCRRCGADVALVPYWASPLLQVCPTAVTIHDLIPLLFKEYRGGLLGSLYLRLVKATARRAPLILTDSEASQEDIIKHLGIPLSRIRTVPLAAQAGLRRVKDVGQLARVRGRYGLPGRFGLYLGGFDRRKNVVGLLNAFAEWTQPSDGDKDDPPRLVIAGKLPDRPSSLFPDPVQVASGLGLSSRIHFPGWIATQDKAALYSLADFFVFPSFYEGFGLPVLEALACGARVIASHRASLPEIVGGAGKLVDPEDTTALAQAMADAWNGSGWDDESATRAVRQAGLFRWEETARLTLEHLTQALPA